MQDIRNMQDIEQLVNAFYGKVQQDELLGPVFEERIAPDEWAQHLRIMYRFWETQLLGGKEYQGNPYARHRTLPIDDAHFERWVQLFHETVDELYAGPTAGTAKTKALSISRIFLAKILFERGKF